MIDALRSKMPEACSYLERAIAFNKHNPYYHLQYGMLLGRLGKTENALAEMNQAEQLDPGNPQCHLSLGELYARQRDFKAARSELEKAVQLNPHLASAYYTLANVYRHLGLKAESERAYATFQQEKGRKGSPTPRRRNQGPRRFSDTQLSGRERTLLFSSEGEQPGFPLYSTFSSIIDVLS